MNIGDALQVAIALDKLGFSSNIGNITEDKLIASIIDEHTEANSRVNTLAKQIANIQEVDVATKIKLTGFLSNLTSAGKLIREIKDTGEIAVAIVTVEDFMNNKEIEIKTRGTKEFEALMNIRKAYGVDKIQFSGKTKDVGNEIDLLDKDVLVNELTKAYNVIEELVLNEGDSNTKDT